MKKITLIYTADSSLMYNSYSLIGVADSKEAAMSLIRPELIKTAKADFQSQGYDSQEQMLNDLTFKL